jgi:PAS domain S-box-containing protein
MLALKSVRTSPGIWRRIGVELAAVVSLIVVGVAVLFHVIDLATREQQRIAVESATDVVSGLVETQLNFVARLVLDYAYWDDALEHLSVTLDRQWAKENIGAQLHSVQGADMAAVIDSENVPRLLFLGGKPVETEGGFNWNALKQLLPTARQAPPIADEVPRSIISSNGNFYVVAAFQLISQSASVADAAQWRRDHPNQSVLVFGHKVDERFTGQLTTIFHIKDVGLNAGSCPKEAAGCVALGQPEAPVGNVSFSVLGVEGFVSRIRQPMAIILSAIISACGIMIARLFALVRRLAIKNDALDAEVALRKRAKEELRESERKFRSLVEGSIQGIAVIRDGKLQFANPSYAAIFGYASPEEILGLPSVNVLFAPDERERLADYREWRLRGESIPSAYEFEGRRKDGSSIWLENRSTVVLWEGKPAVLAAVINVTERKAMERRLAHAHKMEVVGQLAGGTAHDFNNLLQVIQANLELIGLRSNGDAKTMQFQEDAREAVRRGAKLSQQLLAFSRRQTLHPETVDLNGLIERTVGLLKSTLGEDIELDIRLEPGIGSITVDPSGLENAILNIALNARGAMPKGGKLAIQSGTKHLDEEVMTEEGVLPAGDYTEIAMTDTGCGMSPEVLARAFEPFFTTKEVGVGSGLGLSMVYGFAVQSDGHVTLESGPGKGTTVRMIFPAAAEKAEIKTETRETTPVEAGTGTILVVEDDPSVRRSVMIILDMMGYGIREAEDANAALAILDRDVGIDLIFTDVVMPGGMSGVDLAREAVHRRANLKVLLTSGYAEETLAKADPSGTGFALLRKPYSNVQLRETIQSVLLN